MTRQDIAALFDLLEAAGLRPPYDDRAGSDRAVSVWLSTCGAVSAEAMTTAAHAHLRSPGGKWWPKPVELLQLAPRPVLVDEDTVVLDVDWPGRTVSRLADGNLRVRFIDQGVQETLAMEPHPCGKPRCSATCEACNEAGLRRADELARQHLAQPIDHLPPGYAEQLVDEDEVVDQGGAW